MSAADLFVEGFPHGTPQGFEQGCRGGACPAKVERGISCREAKTRAAWDAPFAAACARGEFPSAEEFAPEVPVKKAKRPKEEPIVEKVVEVPAEPEPADGIEHGTRKGYEAHRRRHEVACQPCKDAINAYQKERKAARRVEPVVKLVVDEGEDRSVADAESARDAYKFWRATADERLAKINELEHELEESDDSLREQVALVLELREKLAAVSESVAYDVVAGRTVTITVHVGGA